MSGLTIFKRPEEWRLLLRSNFSRLDLFCDYLELSKEQRSKVFLKAKFPIQVPLRLAKKMKKGTLEDPLVRQFLPTNEEAEEREGFVSDPVCDSSFQKEGTLLQKYHGRVLIVTTGVCAMHCRYCFRQNFDYGGSKRFEREVEWIKEDSTIHEVILSGGDPLSLSDEILDSLLDRLSKIPHIRRIRFHSRFPVGIPERINDSFLAILSRLPQEIYFIIHINHPIEIDDEVVLAIRRLKKIGVTVMNQSVLLKGVNDDKETLKRLCEKLVDSGIIPYYLHQLDRVSGTSHFEVDEKKGVDLLATIARELPGYAIPKYTREISGEAHKRVLYAGSDYKAY